ncbi:hypothetical protein [Burkholderia ubonensis]|uniref:hypothetical protein n=1 Tax=Burkholderia ubonensis TaxID=101571 RepID=UPI0012FA1228|nr:hypothetical protein [Burkholderia ubonensis]
MATTTGAANIVKASAQGLSAAGSVSVPGLQPGDVLLRVMPDGFTSGFESVVSVAGQIQQTADLDWSSLNFTFYLIRGV